MPEPRSEREELNRTKTTKRARRPEKLRDREPDIFIVNVALSLDYVRISCSLWAPTPWQARMPDGDVISSRINHRWRSTLERLRGGASAQEVASHANRAIAETLRANGGIAGQDAYGAVIEARARGDITPGEARAMARLIFQSQEPIPFALVVHRAVDRCLAAPVSTGAALGPGVITVAEAVCHAVMDAELFERVRPALVGKHFADDEAYDRVIGDCRAVLAPVFARIGESLSRDPSANRLRAAPMRRRIRRPSTTAVLKTSLL